MAVESIYDILAWIRENSVSETDKGTKFERLMKAYFQTDPVYKAKFSEVWMWSEWAEKWKQNQPDYGIDLVAKHRDDDGFTAIQTKCYAETTTVDKDEIDSFFTESGKKPFTERIIVATSTQWTKPALASLVDQDKPVVWLSSEDLANAPVDWSRWDPDRLEALYRVDAKELRDHQLLALADVRDGFLENDRGQLIMACGTGKTLAGQAIAEEMVGAGGSVLVLMPSISLVSQTVQAWAADATLPLRTFAVCSDETAGKPHEEGDRNIYDLVYPATTDPKLLAERLQKSASSEKMTAIFSTYHSLPVITEAQGLGAPDFDLIICDEAHRSIGVVREGEEPSAFVQVHDDAYVRADKRLYMTATPRVYTDSAKKKADVNGAEVASMDDPATFGPEFHRLGFDRAVKDGLLCDYKVIVLAVDEQAIAQAFQTQISDENHELQLDEATRIVGCLNAFAKRSLDSKAFLNDPVPMHRAVAFSNRIDDSERFKNLFNEVSQVWNAAGDNQTPLAVEVEHVDGTFASKKREKLLRWLKDDPGDQGCSVLSNARCLTEGVDVPALDAVVFLAPRNSKVDITQAVGRVMRRSDATGKELGYIILPIGIPAGETAESALDHNERYQVVWDVLNALRSHDERLNAEVNKIDLNNELPERIEILPVAFDQEGDDLIQDGDEQEQPFQLELSFPMEEIREHIFAQIVKRVGTRQYWEQWTKQVAEIAERHQTRITALVNDPNLDVSEDFDHFVDGLRQAINDGITRDMAVEMLSQHLVSYPVFEALFGDSKFINNNPVSQAMQKMSDVLAAHDLESELEALEDFYEGVRQRVEGIDNAAGKQKIIKELYNRFFKLAFEKTADRLGIVYTPIELVDFILCAADQALNKYFDGASLSDDGINVLDPFAGTGTFTTRLLQSGLVKPEDLTRKYLSEVHSNEMLLLAYYIATINIESTYHELTDGSQEAEEYQPFTGSVLTDTFQLGEAGSGTGVLDVFPINDSRITRQKSLELKVIVGNPPYSARQPAYNDDNANLKYPRLDQAIEATYASEAKKTKSKNVASLYDPYIRAMRWATDRVNESPAGGVVAFVTNNGFLESATAVGLRKTLLREFHELYVFNLRGNSNNQAEAAREGANVFGVRIGISVLIAVKRPGEVPNGDGILRYRDIGEYIKDTEEKLGLVSQLGADQDIFSEKNWTTIRPNEDGDWINQRSEEFVAFRPLTPTPAGDQSPFFDLVTNGLGSNRDAWNYNSSLTGLKSNVERMVDFFNSELERFYSEHPDRSGSAKSRLPLVRGFVRTDKSQMSWNRADYQYVANGDRQELPKKFWVGVRRPFYKQYVNPDRRLNHMVYQLPKIFPTPEASTPSICFPPPGSMAPPFAALMVDRVPDFGIFWGGSKAVPLWLPGQADYSGEESTLFEGIEDSDAASQSNINSSTLSAYRELIPDVTNADIFYYVYGVLHSTQYRSKFETDLKKTAPRVPDPGSEDIFRKFSAAGQKLSDLHLNYEEVEVWPDLEIRYAENFDSQNENSFRVEKMRYPKIPNPENPDEKTDDLTTIIYNSEITVAQIPLEVHDYVIGSHSAIGWLVNQCRVKKDKASGIVNDPNDWAEEQGNPAYFLDLLQRLVTVSMRSNQIVAELPELDFENTATTS